MADQIARDGTVYASTDGSAWTQIGGVTELSSSISRGRIDTSKLSSDWGEGKYGRGSVSFSVSWIRDETDAGQDIVRSAIENATDLYLRHRPEESSGADQRSSQVIATELPTNNNNDGAVTESISAESTGDPTFDTQ